MTQIAVYKTSSEGCMIIYDLLKKQYDVELVGADDVESGRLREFDLAVFPGGYEHLFRARRNMRFSQEVADYVSGGGRYLGICGGALLASWLGLGDCRMGYLRLFPYYLYFKATGIKGKVKIKWVEDNIFGESGETVMAWAAGPYVLDPGSLKVEALYWEDKPCLPLRGCPAIVSGFHGLGSLVLFGTHPEYPCDSLDNSYLLFDAASWLLRREVVVYV